MSAGDVTPRLILCADVFEELSASVFHDLCHGSMNCVLLVVVLKVEDLMPPVECTHLTLAEPGNQVSDVRLKANDAQLVQLRGCDLAFAEEVEQCCKGVKRTGVVNHVLPRRLPHVGLKPCVVAPKLMYPSTVKASARRCLCLQSC